jgi:hypothetical protein
MMQTKKRKAFRAFMIWVGRTILRVNLQNERPCGCVDLHPKGKNYVMLIPCDSCSKMLARFAKG